MLGGWGVPLPLALGMALTGIGALQRLPALGVIAIALGCGILVATARSDGALLSALARDVPRCALSARVVEPITTSTTVVALDRLDCGSFDLTGPTGLAVIRDRVLDAGSRFRGEGFLVPLGSSATDLMSRRAGASALLDLDRIRSQPPSGAFRVAARLRASLRAATADLVLDRAALLHGLTVGDTSQMAPVVMERFRAAGLTHLVAVSGYIGAYTDAFRDTPVLGAQVGIPGRARPTSVQGLPAVSRRRLVIAGSFEVPRSAWAHR